MKLADLAIAALGLGTGFASTVWVIVGWTSIRLRHYWEAYCYVSLVLVNVISTVIIGSGLAGHPLTLPQGSTVLLLLPIIIFPPILQLRSWLSTRPLIRKQINS